MKTHNVERGMRILGAYFGTYIAVGFVYPLVVGESVFETASKKIGWKEEGQPNMDCQTYYTTMTRRNCREWSESSNK